jgi:monoamine oxidase
MSTDVILIGAGMAGLAAARELTGAGLQVEIIEARDRIGGRVHTIRDPSIEYPVELGAEFVHGLAPEVWLPLQRHNLNVNEVQGDLWCALDGALEPCNFFAEADKILSAMNGHEPDESFLTFLERRFPGNDHAEAKEWATRYVSGFNAANPADISVHWLVHNRQAEEQIEGDRAFRIVGGYQKLLDIFAELRPDNSGPNDRTRVLTGAPAIRLNTVVRAVYWRPGRVRIEALGPQGDLVFEAPRAVITVPVGVLQSPGAIRFDPALPDKKFAALDRLVMGKVTRVTFCFRDPFWQEIRPPQQDKTLGDLSFLFSQQDCFPTWWTQMPEKVPIITGWSAGPSAENMAGMADGRVTDIALGSLAALLGQDKPRLQSQLHAAYFHNWDSDPFSRGAYTYVKAGGEGCQSIVGAPVDDTLFFAGEATDTGGHNGTVHGAIASGQRAAKEILKSQ